MKNKKRKEFLIFCDLDGTLLNDEGLISSRTVKVIKEISSKGHKLCLATGRPLRDAVKFYTQLELKTLMGNQNGAFINNPSDPKFQTSSFTFSSKILFDLLNNKIVNRSLMNVVIENSKGSYLQKAPKDKILEKEIFNFFHISFKNKKDIYNHIIDVKKFRDDVNTVLLFIKPNSNLVAIKREIKNLYKTVDVRHWTLPSNSWVLEICPFFTNKKTFLNLASSYYGIPYYRCIGFGDNGNDVELLRKVTYSYAMCNGSSEVIDISQTITKYSNNDDGVAYELAKFFKINSMLKTWHK